MVKFELDIDTHGERIYFMKCKQINHCGDILLHIRDIDGTRVLGRGNMFVF